jgi:hypothetical protein
MGHPNRTIIWCLLAAARCMGGPSMPEEPNDSRMLPRWQVGQKWKVEYRVRQPSPVKGEPNPTPEPFKSIWEYEVLSPAKPDETIRLSAKDLGGKRLFELVFDAKDFTLRSATEQVRGHRLPVLENSPHTPYYGYNQTQGILFDWPRFPQLAANEVFEFKTAEDRPVQCKVVFHSAREFDVLMRSESKLDSGFSESVTSTQSWTIGQPWWSKASVRADYNDHGDKSSVVLMEAELLH